jgi:uncharacterized protein (TIGR02145 family)
MVIFNKFMAILIPVCIFLVFFTGCSKNGEDPPVIEPTVPVLNTTNIADISQTSAKSVSTVTSDGGAPVTSRGVCWNTTNPPEIKDPHTTDGTGTGTFESQLTELTPNTMYYARAYATNSKGTAYGSTASFRTLKTVVDSVADFDGNIYHVVPIGRQKWLRENLRVTHYRNGESIPNVPSETQWKILTTGAYCVYDNQAANVTAYGYLYNWHALGDTRGLCPTGWHVPSDSEWTELGDSLGGNLVAGGRLKSTGTIEGGTGLWYAPNTDGSNSSGFTGLPAGYRINYGTYYSMGNVGYFWTSSAYSTDKAWLYILDANNGELNINFDFKTNGFSVRCCKD